MKQLFLFIIIFLLSINSYSFSDKNKGQIDTKIRYSDITELKTEFSFSHRFKNSLSGYEIGYVSFPFTLYDYSISYINVLLNSKYYGIGLGLNSYKDLLGASVILRIGNGDKFILYLKGNNPTKSESINGQEYITIRTMYSGYAHMLNKIFLDFEHNWSLDRIVDEATRGVVVGNELRDSNTVIYYLIKKNENINYYLGGGLRICRSNLNYDIDTLNIYEEDNFYDITTNYLVFKIVIQIEKLNIDISLRIGNGEYYKDIFHMNKDHDLLDSQFTVGINYKL